MDKTQHTLLVEPADLPDQFWVGGVAPNEGFERGQCSFIGFFGTYGPNMFAAAPDMLTALADLVQFADDHGLEQEKGGVAIILAARAAIAKAEGSTNA